jgi:hypothetical protein
MAGLCLQYLFYIVMNNADQLCLFGACLKNPHIGMAWM